MWQYDVSFVLSLSFCSTFFFSRFVAPIDSLGRHNCIEKLWTSVF